MAKHPAAVALGALGGRSKSNAKARAARVNGARGGRPSTLSALVVAAKYAALYPANELWDDQEIAEHQRDMDLIRRVLTAHGYTFRG